MPSTPIHSGYSTVNLLTSSNCCRSSTGAANGTHSLTARACDAANHQSTSAAASVTINNGTTTAPRLRSPAYPRASLTADLQCNSDRDEQRRRRRERFLGARQLPAVRYAAAAESDRDVAVGSDGSVRRQSERRLADSRNSEGTATLTMTLRDASGATVRTVNQAITITH